jgi:hypothetical protein
LWLAATVVLLMTAGAIQHGLTADAHQRDLLPAGQEVTGGTALTVVPAGLRPPAIAMLSISADKQKQAQRYYKYEETANRICRLMPHFPDVWGYHAWNMAWNISVAMHTPDTRWEWVHKGVRLLRDEGIRNNPESIILYRELAWIFGNKMGDNMDEMHMAYKQQWASRMQRVVGSPPFGTTAEAIDAFRPIAEAPIDRTRLGDSDQPVQEHKLDELLADQAVADYARRLEAQDVDLTDGSLLDAYNRFTDEKAVAVTRAEPTKIETDRDRAIEELINNPLYRPARDRLVAFTRAQMLWNRYKMDPAWMLGLMEEYGPLDWRLTWSHAIYWITYGFERTGVDLSSVDEVNAQRVVLNSLKDLTWNGRLAYRENPQRPEYPQLIFYSDVRFIEATQQEFLAAIARLTENRQRLSPEAQRFKDNGMKPGHVNYLSSAVAMLWAGGREEYAQQLYDWMRDKYELQDEHYQLPVDEFVVWRIRDDEAPVAQMAIAQVTAAIEASLLDLVRGDNAGYEKRLRHAEAIYNEFHQYATERNALPPVGALMAEIAASLLVAPEMRYVELSMDQRITLYNSLSDQIRVPLYDLVNQLLRDEFEAQRPDQSFDAAFPPPPGIEQYREYLRRQTAVPTGVR